MNGAMVKFVNAAGMVEVDMRSDRQQRFID
jgi:hypothetical protein